jgi:hypothetical protein
MDWSTFFGFTVVGAIVTTIGTLIALVLKETFLVKSFELWKAQHTIEQAKSKYRDPLIRSALELCNRLSQICDEYPSEYFDRSVLRSKPRKTASTAVDNYYKKYQLISTTYRLCALLGWIQLYRQEIVFLDSDDELEKAINWIRKDLAEGHINTADDWEDWRDLLLLREEQRAIGESIITTTNGKSVVMGYSQFCEYFPSSGSDSIARWFKSASELLLDQRAPKDFRLTRMKLMVVHLVDLAELLGAHRLRPEHLVARTRYLATAKEIYGDYSPPKIKKGFLNRSRDRIWQEFEKRFVSRTSS